MKKYITLIITTLALSNLYMWNTAFSGSISVTSDVTASLVRQLSFVYNQELDFGTIQSSSADGTVVLSPSSDTPTSSSGSIVIDNTNAHRAKVTVSGSPNSSYSITTPSSIFFIAQETQSQVDGIPFPAPSDIGVCDDIGSITDQLTLLYCIQYTGLVEQGRNKLLVNSFSISDNQGNLGFTQTTTASGTDILFIGGTLNITSRTQSNTSYSGEVPIVVSY